MQALQSTEACPLPDMFVLVADELAALGIVGLHATEIGEDALLVDDLGLDSLKFVDLTLRLEEALGLEEFPMQDWVDAQLEAQRPLSVRTLVEACNALVGKKPEAARV